jgi:anaerobic magnesium-protoporphyrin IX monomethyl ester cyclase
MSSQSKVLVVDLNNFASYPTLAIGYLVASLRDSDMDVDVLCPLSHDVPAKLREKIEGWKDQVQRRVYFSTNPALEWSRRSIRSLRSWWSTRPHPRVMEEVSKALDQKPDVVLLSAYLNHYPSVVEIGKLAAKKGVPVLLGGPVFNIDKITDEWLHIPGITALIGGEVDRALPGLVRDTVAGKDLLNHPGVYYPDGRRSPVPPPLKDLSSLPVPDFRDYPWGAYAERVIPVMAGRGCSWGQCKFCGDVFTANGRTFRTRTVDSMLDELVELSDRHESKNFILLDIKLNSDVKMWRGLIERIQDRIPGAGWVGTVHVDRRPDNGLSPEDLKAARESGMMRINFGLESGSQRMLDEMDKGTDLAAKSMFMHNAHAAGLSVRSTVMQGYPSETAKDLDMTVATLAEHRKYLDRVRLSQFKAIPGTRFQAEYDDDPKKFPGLNNFAWSFRDASAWYRYGPSSARDYRKAKRRLLDIVHSINKEPLRSGAEAFDGLM